MQDKEYILTESGLLIPRGVDSARQAPHARPALESSRNVTGSDVDRAGRWFNLASIVIQLVTVVVLWLTFKNTVIPTQQKELLAEQVAGLEKDRRQTVVAIEQGKRRVEKLNSTLSGQRLELSQLQQERNALEAGSKRANAEATAARHSEQTARGKEQIAQRAAQSAQAGLTDARWRIFAEEANWQIWRGDSIGSLHQSQIETAVNDANAIENRLSTAQEIVRDIELYENNWPDYKAIVKLTASRIRALRSNHYTPEMADTFADHFEREGANFHCNRPDFAEIKQRYLLALAKTGPKASEESREEMEKVRREYAAKGKQVVFEDGWEDSAVSRNLIGLEYGVKRDLLDELLALPRECAERFKDIGSKFLEQKNKNPQQLPNDILY